MITMYEGQRCVKSRVVGMHRQAPRQTRYRGQGAIPAIETARTATQGRIEADKTEMANPLAVSAIQLESASPCSSASPPSPLDSAWWSGFSLGYYHAIDAKPDSSQPFSLCDAFQAGLDAGHDALIQEFEESRRERVGYYERQDGPGSADIFEV
jgi:hypothetical protein